MNVNYQSNPDSKTRIYFNDKSWDLLFNHNVEKITAVPGSYEAYYTIDKKVDKGIMAALPLNGCSSSVTFIITSDIKYKLLSDTNLSFNNA